MDYIDRVYYIKFIRIMFNRMNAEIKMNFIQPYFKKVLSRWIDEVYIHQQVVGLEKISLLKKELIEAYLSLF